MVEAIAAITIAAIAGAGLVVALSSARIRTDEAEQRRVALRQAMVVMAEALADRSSAGRPTAGAIANGRITWSVARVDLGPLYPGLERVRVHVTWRQGRGSGAMQLEAYGLRHEP